MADWCETCGQQVSDVAQATDAIWLGAPTDEHHHQVGASGAKKKPGRDRKLVGIVGAAILMWGLFVGLGSVISPDKTIDEQAAADIQAAQLERLTEEAEQAARDRIEAEQQAEQQAAAELGFGDQEATIAEVPGDYGAADAAPGFPDAALVDPDAPIDDGRAQPLIDATGLSLRAATSTHVRALQEQMADRASQIKVAYRADRGVVLVDLQSGTAVVAAVAPELSSVALGRELLRVGPATYAIDPTSLLVTQVGQGASLVLNDSLDGNIYVVDAKSVAGQTSILEVIVAGEYSFYRLPSAPLQLQPIDGLGVIAVPEGRTGETLIAGAQSFVRLSEHPLLAASERALLAQRCTSSVNCTLVISNVETGRETPVPSNFANFGDRYELAPSGELLVRYTINGFAELFSTAGQDQGANGQITPVTANGVQSVAWAPDSDFFAWFDLIDTPELRLMFADGTSLSVDLSDMGAPAPSSPELIVFAVED